METIAHTKSFKVTAPVAVLFPLFSPEGEKHWVPGWDYTNIMKSKELSEDYIFLTENHDHASSKAIWIVKRYKPEKYFVQYYKVEPGDKVGVITIQCSEQVYGVTKTEVTYKYTSLSETGKRFINTFDERAYDEFITEWKELLTRYLTKKGHI